MSQSTSRRDTLYEQVLEHAQREIDEASTKIDELRKSLALLDARVEAAKSVYEAVAARLNLEDEGNLPAAVYDEVPPRVDELDAEESAPAPVQEAQLVRPPAPAAPPASPAPAPPTMADTPKETAPKPAPPIAAEAGPVPAKVPASGGGKTFPSGNGSTPPAVPSPPEAPSTGGNDVSMDLIRRHLEERARRNQSELKVTPPPPMAPSPAPVVDADGEEDEEDERAVGFPGLSEADRRLIEEHMRRRAEASQDR